MVKLYTELEIEAPAGKVWQVLTNFADYAVWNPFIHRIKGEATVGAHLEVYIHPLGEGGMIFRPTVLTVEPERELRWRGHKWLPGLFDGEHIFNLEPLGENRVHFVQQEIFTSLFVPFLARWLCKRTRPSFELMSQALKVRAERIPAYV